ncbi:unnamed protein product [Gongylonema pulchrum]|uniref:BHLH domain-containing protein n=1 Tax=Gongylonema pulchrum TaxID=637853 RepID=A0A183DSF8_9BILA|nr:unnamed protein product [Gongylonema pulchrum]
MVAERSNSEQYERQREATVYRARTVHKSLNAANSFMHRISETSKRRRRDSLLNVKDKIHSLLRRPLRRRSHRYDVRAAERAAVIKEEELLGSCKNDATSSKCRHIPDELHCESHTASTKELECPQITANDDCCLGFPKKI